MMCLVILEKQIHLGYKYDQNKTLEWILWGNYELFCLTLFSIDWDATTGTKWWDRDVLDNISVVLLGNHEEVTKLRSIILQSVRGLQETAALVRWENV